MCPQAITKYPTVSRTLAALDAGSACDKMIYAYDRDAGAFRLPENVGVRIGKVVVVLGVVYLIHFFLPGDSLYAFALGVPLSSTCAQCASVAETSRRQQRHHTHND